MGTSQTIPQLNRVVYANPLVWLDPNISEEEFSELSDKFIVKKIQTVEEYFDYVKSKIIYTTIPLICAGSLFESLEEQLKLHWEQAQKIKKIYVFCYDVEKNKHLRNHEKVACVTNDTQKLIEEIKKQVYQIELPSFRNFSDNDEKTIQVKYSYFLTYLTYPIQQSERRQLIVRFIKSFNRNNISLEGDFPIADYPSSFNQIKILQLYSGGYSFFNYINKILKTNTLTNIEEAHILINDLYLAIRNFSSFCRRSSVPSLLFRGSFLSESQIDSLKKSIGSSIETLGFLSTSIREKVAVDNVFRKNVLFKIYIPNFFRDKNFMNIKLRGGYVEINTVFTPKYPEEMEVLFNIKSVFTVLRVYSEIEQITVEEEDNKKQIRQMFTVELLFGKDQILLFLNENKNNFITKIHEKLPRSTQMTCKKCRSTLHLIGTISKRRICLTDFNSKQLYNQSFVLQNSKSTITGISVEYDELALQFDHPKKREYCTLCVKCESKVKCSGCFKEFCLCFLHDHNQQHLENCHILVERDLPRYIMLELNESELILFQNHYLLESQITCSADAFRLMKDKSSFQKAWQQYNAMIEREEFYSLDYTTRFNLYENRAESYRLRKYLIDAEKEKLTIEKLKFCIEDYERCYELVKDKQFQEYRCSKSIMNIGIIEDDIAQKLEKDEEEKNMPHLESKLMYDKALTSYKRATQLLVLIKERRFWTKEQTLLNMAIKNCQPFIFWHRKQFQTAIQKFQSLLDLVKTLERPVKRDEAKFLNNTVCCMNQYVQKLNQEDLDLILNILEKSVQNGERSYNLRLCLFGADYNLTLNSKLNYEKALKLKDQYKKKYKKRSQPTPI